MSVFVIRNKLEGVFFFLFKLELVKVLRAIKWLIHFVEPVALSLHWKRDAACVFYGYPELGFL